MTFWRSAWPTTLEDLRRTPDGEPTVDLLYHEAGIPPIHTDKEARPPPARGADRRRDGVTPEDAELDVLEAAFLN